MSLPNPDRDPVVVLLVEDNPGDVRLVREGFDAVEFDAVVHAVTTCGEAVEFLTERAGGESADYPDVLLLDLNLPKRDGFAVLEALHDTAELPPIPVLVLTSSEAEADVVRSYELHANSYITKPSDPTAYVSMARAIRDFWFETAHLPPA